MLKEKVKQALEEIEVSQASNLKLLEDLRIKFLGKKGLLNQMFEEFKLYQSEEKKELGKKLNELKIRVSERLEELKNNLDKTIDDKNIFDDLSKPAFCDNLGSRHPISILRKQIVDIFSKIGFVVADGPEMEDDWHNFTALNLPEHHPARDMQDTFFVQKFPDFLLRTHTSSVQIRHMEKNTPPIRILSPGRVFRNEAISYRSHCIFHQIEGLYIDKDVSFADMQQTLLYFVKEFFGKSKIRIRPSYFPFTEPSCEVDVFLGCETEMDYKITKGTGWLEIMGCGMVDPAVLENVGIDPDTYSGFAFGLGLERTAMLIYQVKDIRMFFENDVRFLKQFSQFI